MAVEIKGIEGVLERLEGMADERKMQGAIRLACAKVERAAKQKAPKHTGDLRRSITSEVQGLTGVVYTPLEYAPYVEYGTGLFSEKGGRTNVPWAYRDEKTGELIFTSGQDPQPYMRPALNENREEIVRILREGLLSD